MDVIGPINPKSSRGHSYILTSTDYFTKWKEERALKKGNIDELISFIVENILSCFKVPEKFITDIGTIFIGPQSLLPSAENMELLWGNHQTIICKEWTCTIYK